MEVERIVIEEVHFQNAKNVLFLNLGGMYTSVHSVIFKTAHVHFRDSSVYYI